MAPRAALIWGSGSQVCICGVSGSEHPLLPPVGQPSPTSLRLEIKLQWGFCGFQPGVWGVSGVSCVTYMGSICLLAQIPEPSPQQGSPADLGQ